MKDGLAASSSVPWRTHLMGAILSLLSVPYIAHLLSSAGMFNNYAAVLTNWTDTTNMDNLHASAFSHDGLSVAGSKCKPN